MTVVHVAFGRVSVHLGLRVALTRGDSPGILGRSMIDATEDSMGTAENTRLLQHVYAEPSKGNAQALLDSLAEDIQWTIIGSTALSGTSRGKGEVIEKLLKPVRARLADGP